MKSKGRRRIIPIFDGKTEENLRIIVDAQFKRCVTVHRIRKGVDQLDDVSITDHGIYPGGTRWYVFPSPWHYSENKKYGANGNTPILAKNRNKLPGATLEIPSDGPARLHYSSREDIVHLVERK